MLIIGFGAMIIASHQHFVSAAINYIAASTLAVYLIHDYPMTRTLLASVFNIVKFYDNGWAVLLSVGIAFLILLACLCMSIPRRAIWRVRLDKQPGKLFEVAHTQLEKVGRRLKPAFSRVYQVTRSKPYDACIRRHSEGSLRKATQAILSIATKV